LINGFGVSCLHGDHLAQRRWGEHPWSYNKVMNSIDGREKYRLEYGQFIQRRQIYEDEKLVFDPLIVGSSFRNQ
jgi:hypothetical protein